MSANAGIANQEFDMEKRQVLIVGGGASGLMAAIMAARNGAAVTVLEQNEKPGKKICATGNGRCNLTNLAMPKDAYRGTHPEFVRNALEHFTVEDTLNFFREIGICTVNKNGYIYPRSLQAQSVVDVLCMEARSLGVKLKTNQKVTSVSSRKTKWLVTTQDWKYEGDALVLANGSRASAISGSDGSGYELARSLGHQIIPVYPALTGLKCKGTFFKAWAGVRTEGRVSLYVDGNPVKSEQGELQLTEYGISGIPVFQISRYAVCALHEKASVQVKIDFFPEMTEKEMTDFLAARQKSCPYKNKKELLTGMFPEKLIKVFTSQKELISSIKNLPLSVSDGMSYTQAQVCTGGVDTAEVNSQTMESLLKRNLYFTGELLDIDGTCGGYNLQWAWSSGAAAGRHAAKGGK